VEVEGIIPPVVVAGHPVETVAAAADMSAEEVETPEKDRHVIHLPRNKAVLDGVDVDVVMMRGGIVLVYVLGRVKGVDRRRLR
jgi:hypothetical protein